MKRHHLKITLFTPYFTPDNEAAATRNYWFYQTLTQAGYNVEIISNHQLILKLANNKSHPIYRLIKEIFTGIELFLRLFIGQRDLVFFSSPPFFTSIIASLACVLQRKKFIIDVRDIYPEFFFETGLVKKDSLLGKLITEITRQYYYRSSAIISVTPQLCNLIRAYNAKNVHLIMNGYDEEIFRPNINEKKFSQFTLVFHGNLGRVQNIETLLTIADHLKGKDIQIIVAGDGPKSAEIMQRKPSHLNFLGPIPYHEIPKLLQKCHLGLSFRTDDTIGREAFPVKIFEYIGTGLPVISTPKSEAGALIEKHHLGFQFENYEIDNIVQKILEIQKSIPQTNPVKIFSRQAQSIKILDILHTIFPENLPISQHKVSIISPCYNAEQHILTCYESIKNQTHSNWEWIVVDDSSKDQSLKLIKNLAQVDNRIKLIQNKHNMGPGASRNTGIEYASGEFISFLDIDDGAYPEKLQHQLHFMTTQNVEFTFHYYKKKFMNNLEGQTIITAPDRVSYNKMLKTNYICNSTVMIKKSSLNGFVYPTNTNRAEDYLLWLSLLTKIPYAYCIPYPLGWYRVGNNESLSGPKLKMAFNQWRIYRNHLKLSPLKAAYYYVSYAIKGTIKQIKK